MSSVVGIMLNGHGELDVVWKMFVGQNIDQTRFPCTLALSHHCSPSWGFNLPVKRQLYLFMSVTVVTGVAPDISASAEKLPCKFQEGAGRGSLQRTFEIWSFAITFFFKLWLCSRKFAYGKKVRLWLICNLGLAFFVLWAGMSSCKRVCACSSRHFPLPGKCDLKMPGQGSWWRDGGKSLETNVGRSAVAVAVTVVVLWNQV